MPRETARREVYSSNKSRLYRYGRADKRRHRTPVLLVPNLGISRPDIFDLLPGSSFIEWMVGEGFDIFLLDWGVFGPEDDELSFDEAVAGILPCMVQKVLEAASARRLSLIGYCMGATMAASLLASHPEVPVRNFVDMAGPIDFTQAGLFQRWLDERYFPLDRLVDTVGSIPPAAVWWGGTMARPTMGITALVDLWVNATNPRRVGELCAAAKWVGDFVGIPREFFRQWVREFYQQNALYSGGHALRGRPATLSAVRCPVLAVAATADPIAPAASVRALIDAAGGRDRTYLEVPGTHLSLLLASEAEQATWPELGSWLAVRS